MGKEILLMADAVSNEKGVSKDVILGAIETALAIATRKRNNGHIDVRVAIDPEQGDYETFRRWHVVEQLIDEEGEPLNPEAFLLLAEATEKKPDAKIGDVIEEPMASVEFGRIAAQTAKQVITQELRKAERAQVVAIYAEKVGELINGMVKKTTRDSVILDLGNNVEALLKRSEMLPREAVRMGDRLRAYLYAVNEEVRGPQLLVSRIHNSMLTELFKIEVPEIGEEVIQIMGVARDPGARSKIAVKTNDGRIDPVGACVGMRGARVQAVSGELGGERIDIVVWDPEPVQFVINAMAPADVVSIVMDEETHTIDIGVKEEQLSQAIGRNGQNVRLASEITGWTLNVMSEDDAKEKTSDETENAISMFSGQLNIDEEVAHVLVEEGFTSVEEVAYVPAQELLDIEEFDEELVDELRTRAKDVLLTQAIATEEKIQSVELDQSLLAVDGIDDTLAYTLTSKGIVSGEDLAELSVDDLIELVQIDREQAAELIMAARQPWFAEEE